MKIKRIIIIIVQTFVFLSALPAKITQTKADEIVLERISQETQPYIVFAKEGIQTNMSVTTLAGEELELDYPCWVYYTQYPLICDAIHCYHARYMIVNINNGNLLEINKKMDLWPSDLAEWRVVKATNCDIPLASTLWASVDNLPMGNLEFGKVYVINTVDELKQHPYFSQNGVSIPDLTTKSIIVNYFSGCVFCEVKSAFCVENGYNWNIVYHANPNIMCFRAESFITYMFVDKIPDNSTVTLNATVVSCTNEPMTKGNVLMLKVDYLTNKFEGGYEFTFDNVPNSFNVRREYMSPGDFGYVKFYYHETGEMLFYGTIHWMGEGQIHFPENLMPASAFDVDPSRNIVTPKNGFENILPEYQPYNMDYEQAWGSIQSLVKVREYLKANPEQQVKIFLYTPCVGVGDPEHWDWIIFLKKGDDNNQTDCDQNVIIDAEEYFNVSEFRGNISNIRIEGNDLKFTISANGCDGSSWLVKLITTGAIEKSLPPQRTLQLSFVNNEICEAELGKEYSLNIECLKVEGCRSVLLNISGKQILYEYESEEDPMYPTTIYRLSDEILLQMRNVFKQRNPNVFSSLNQFGFCADGGLYGPSGNPGGFTKEEAIAAVKEFLARNPEYTGKSNPENLQFKNVTSSTGYNNAINWYLFTENQTINNIEIDYTGISFRTHNKALIWCGGNHFPDVYMPEKFNYDVERAKSKLLGKEIIHLGWGGTYSAGIVTVEHLQQSTAKLIIVPIKTDEKIELRVAWQICLGAPLHYIFEIDVMKGEVVREEPTIIH